MSFSSIDDALSQIYLCADSELYDEAQSLIAQALEQAPEHPELLYYRAYVYLLQEEVDKAADAFNAYDELYPDTLNGLYLRALWNKQAGEYEEAIDCFEHLLAEPDTDRQAEYLYNMAWCLDEIGKYDEALAAIEACIALEEAPNPISWRLRIHLWQQTEPPAVQIDQARAAYWQTFPDDAVALL